MEKIMTTNSVVALYDTHQQAENAIKELQEAGETHTPTNMLSATTTPATA
jgi:hypothetical protein